MADGLDIDAMLSRMAPKVVITWQNGEVCRGRDAVKAFYARMAANPKRIWWIPVSRLNWPSATR